MGQTSKKCSLLAYVVRLCLRFFTLCQQHVENEIDAGSACTSTTMTLCMSMLQVKQRSLSQSPQYIAFMRASAISSDQTT